MSQSIKNDYNFQSVHIDRRFYVIPDSIVANKKGYLKVCDDALKNCLTECVSMKTFYKKLKEEEGKHERN